MLVEGRRRGCFAGPEVRESGSHQCYATAGARASRGTERLPHRRPRPANTPSRCIIAILSQTRPISQRAAARAATSSAYFPSHSIQITANAPRTRRLSRASRPPLVLADRRLLARSAAAAGSRQKLTHQIAAAAAAAKAACGNRPTRPIVLGPRSNPQTAALK